MLREILVISRGEAIWKVLRPLWIRVRVRVGVRVRVRLRVGIRVRVRVRARVGSKA